MKHQLKVFGLLTLLCFSFYYTNQIAKWMQKKDPIYESILASKEDYEVDSVNATIQKDTIIPGLMGTKVNIEKSFRLMKNDGYFSVNRLVFEEVKPTVSLEENKEKIILQGNTSKNAVSIILASESQLEYFEEMGIPYSYLTTKENMTKHLAYGNKINVDWQNYQEVEKYLQRQKESQPYCIENENQENNCQKYQKYILKKTEVLQNSTFPKNYDKCSSGSIIYLDSNLSISNIKLLLNQIYFRGLKILSLSEMLSETRS